MDDQGNLDRGALPPSYDEVTANPPLLPPKRRQPNQLVAPNSSVSISVHHESNAQVKREVCYVILDRRSRGQPVKQDDSFTKRFCCVLYKYLWMGFAITGFFATMFMAGLLIDSMSAQPRWCKQWKCE